MERLGVINISSNIIRLMLVEIEKDGYFHILDELHSNFTFCYDKENMHPISPNSLLKITSTLKTFKELCTASSTSKIILTASENFTLDYNKKILTETIKKNLDLDVKILTFDEEIKLTSLGVVRSMNIKNSLLVYVGRIITHIVKITDNEITNYHTFNFGSMDISYNFNLSDRILSNDINKALEFINDSLNNIPWIANENYDSIIISGEIARTLHKIDKIKKRYPLSIEHYYSFDTLDLNDIYNLLKSKDKKQRSKIDGLDFELSDIVIGGTSILNSISSLVNCDKLFISSTGLREGIVYDYIINKYDILMDNLNYSISGILNSLNINKIHATQVYLLALKLYEGLKPIHKIDDSYLNILKTACLLHDSGISINYQNHHVNSFYIIMNSSLNNLTHRELLMSAGIAASHRFNSYKVPFCQFSSIINKLDLKIIDILGVILKIAEGLDRSLINSIHHLSVNILDEDIEILLYSDNNIDIEISQAMRAENNFKEIFHKNLIIRKA